MEKVVEPGKYPKDTQVEKQYERPGLEHDLKLKPTDDKVISEDATYFKEYKAAGKLKGKKALITGGDSGIGKAVAILFAKEGSIDSQKGADVAINYLKVEQKDADKTRKEIEEFGSKCLLVPGDLRSEQNCKSLIEKTAKELGGLDILVNNAAEQHIVGSIKDITAEQIENTFQTNIISMFFLVKHAMPYLTKGSSIINSTSVVAYRGSPGLLDYAATKGAIVGFTRSLAKQIAKDGIRVNAVAPGPVWTPLQPISRDEESMDKFANEPSVLLGRVAQPSEIATSYVFLASTDASQFTGQVLHPNGGEIMNT